MLLLVWWNIVENNIILEILSPFIILLEHILVNCPVMDDYSLSLLPALDKSCRPYCCKNSKNKTKRAVKCFNTILLYHNNLVNKKYKTCDRWKNEPCLVMDQKGKLKSILFTIVALHEVYWAKISVEVSTDEFFINSNFWVSNSLMKDSWLFLCRGKWSVITPCWT